MPQWLLWWENFVGWPSQTWCWKASQTFPPRGKNTPHETRFAEMYLLSRDSSQEEAVWWVVVSMIAEVGRKQSPCRYGVGGNRLIYSCEKPIGVWSGSRDIIETWLLLRAFFFLFWFFFLLGGVGQIVCLAISPGSALSGELLSQSHLDSQKSCLIKTWTSQFLAKLFMEKMSRFLTKLQVSILYPTTLSCCYLSDQSRVSQATKKVGLVFKQIVSPTVLWNELGSRYQGSTVFFLPCFFSWVNLVFSQILPIHGKAISSPNHSFIWKRYYRFPFVQYLSVRDVANRGRQRLCQWFRPVERSPKLFWPLFFFFFLSRQLLFNIFVSDRKFHRSQLFLITHPWENTTTHDLMKK